jgi:hypothetical protein
MRKSFKNSFFCWPKKNDINIAPHTGIKIGGPLSSAPDAIKINRLINHLGWSSLR